MSANECRVLQLVQDRMDRLSRSERIVGEWLLEHPQEVVFSSITELADQLSVGETTILRFCRKIGLRGYQEFKLSLASSLGERLLSPDADATPHRAEGAVPGPFGSLISEHIRAIQETADICKLESLQEASEILTVARRIHFYGVGSSGVTALDAKYKLLRIGLQADCFLDPHLQAMAATSLGPEDAAVGLSVSGSTKDTVVALRLARESGAKTISLTSHTRSPITKHSTVVLLVSAKESPLQGGAYSAKIAQLTALDMLVSMISRRLGPAAVASRERTAQAVLDRLY